MNASNPTTKVQHVGVRVRDFDWYRRFFQDIMGMPVTLEKYDTENNLDQIWIGGVQLQHAISDAIACCETQQMSHIGIESSDPDNLILAVSSVEGVASFSGKLNWFQLPEGHVIEIVGIE